jgi:hypothetical protein
MAVVLTPVQTKQIRINAHKGNNTKNTVNTSTHITKTLTHYKIHTYIYPHITKSTHTYTHITKSTHTYTHTLQNPHIHTPTQYKTR